MARAKGGRQAAQPDKRTAVALWAALLVALVASPVAGPRAPRARGGPAAGWCAAGRSSATQRHRLSLAAPSTQRGWRPQICCYCKDWRDFRAELVERERREAAGDVGNWSASAVHGWAHSTPLIEQGSVLVSAPGDNFVLDQQYFHKAVILVLRHGSEGTMGVILNRPTALEASGTEGWSDWLSIPVDALFSFFNVHPVRKNWIAWFGGDCQGLGLPPADRVCTCLHTAERLAAISEQIIKGVYLIDLMQARALVMAGQARQDEFLALMGYCGWAPGQLQAELDRGQSWILAAADQQALLGDVAAAQSKLSARLSAATAKVRRPSAADVGDGIKDWRRLVSELGVEKSRSSDDESHSNAVLRQWIERSLIPANSPLTTVSPSVRGGGPEAMRPALRTGRVLRASATEWLLGSPTSSRESGEDSGMPRAAQYLHKAVLLLLEDSHPRKPAALVLLNGPKVGVAAGAFDIFFGGTVRPKGAGLLEIPGGGILGRVVLPPGGLERLVSIGALGLVEGADVGQLMSLPPDRRWEAAGGSIDSLADAVTARLGDEQRRKWYQRFLGMNLPTDP